MPANKGFYTRRRVDKNQTEIVKVLKQLGCSVVSLADKGHGVPDLLVGYKAQNYLVEVKGKKGKYPVKVLASTTEEFTKPVHIRANAFSKKAKELIEANGGKAEVI